MTTATIHDLINDMAQRGRERIAEAERQAKAAEEARLEEERQRIAQMWAPHMEQISAALSDWMHAYLQRPQDTKPVISESRYGHYEVYQIPVVLSLPGLAPIHVYTYGDDVCFDVPTPSAGCDEYADPGEEWFVCWSRYRAERHEIADMTTDVAVAVALAQSAAAALAVVEEEVRRRNAEAQVEAEAEARLRHITFSDEATNADRYYRGFNDGYEFAQQGVVE